MIHSKPFYLTSSVKSSTCQDAWGSLLVARTFPKFHAPVDTCVLADVWTADPSRSVLDTALATFKQRTNRVRSKNFTQATAAHFTVHHLLKDGRVLLKKICKELEWRWKDNNETQLSDIAQDRRQRRELVAVSMAEISWRRRSDLSWHDLHVKSLYYVRLPNLYYSETTRNIAYFIVADFPRGLVRDVSDLSPISP